MTYVVMGLGVIFLLAGVNAVAVWFGGDVANEPEEVVHER